MRLGVFGGAFNPVHFGHLLLAEQCREQCELDQVWFIPSGNPPHKEKRELAPDADRVDLLELATAGVSEFVVSRIELGCEENTYTFKTLEQLHDEDPTRELFLLIGADLLDDLPSWRNPNRIIELATIVVVNRENATPPAPDFVQHQGGEIQIVNLPTIGFSATDIRSRIKTGKSIRFMVPRAVDVCIHDRQLYGAE